MQKLRIYKTITQSKENKILWMVPDIYPIAIIIKKNRLLPPVVLLLIDL
jgi:hypothetical protein